MNDVEYILRIVLKARDEMAAVLAKARLELIAFSAETKKLNTQMGGLNRTMNTFNQRANTLTERLREWRTLAHAVGDDNDDIGDSLHRLSGHAGSANSAFGDVERTIKRFTATTKENQSTVANHDRQLTGWRAKWAAVRNEVKGTNENIATLDNKLRGALFVFAFAATQQLTTALIGLGGELVAVAGSAAMAGGAIAGMGAAAGAQAVPAILLLVGALQRVKAVTDAFQQSQLLQKAEFANSAKEGAKNADTLDTITNAQESLADATRNVADANDSVTQASEKLRSAQQDLNDTRKDGLRQLQDLVDKEKEAKLAAEGAALSQADAQKALQLAIQQGNSSEIARRQLDLRQATLETQTSRRSAVRSTADRKVVGGNVENLDSVKSAEDSVKQASRGLDQAKASVEDAERSVAKASRGLEKAKRDATDAGASVLTAKANLDFLLSQLSPAEQKLYKSVQRIYKDYRRVFIGDGTKGSGIYGTLVDSFSNGVDAVDKLLRNAKFVSTLQGLADGMASQFNKITAAFTSPEMVGQFERIMDQAKGNLPAISDIFIKLAKSFFNIVEAANPALKEFLKFLDGAVSRLLNFTGGTEGKKKMEDFFLTGEKHLESWLKLVFAVVNLFAAITGAGGAAEGKHAVDDLTKSLNDMANKVRKNAGDVKKFFHDARDAADDVLSVLKTLAVALFGLFNEGRLHSLAEFLNKTLIPALAIVIKTVSGLTSIAITFLNLPFVSEIAKWTIVLIGVSQAAASLAAAFRYFNHLKVFGLLITGAKALNFQLQWTRLLAEEAGVSFLTMARARVVESLQKLRYELQFLTLRIKEAAVAMVKQFVAAMRAVATAATTLATKALVGLRTAIIAVGRAMMAWIVANPIVAAIAAIVIVVLLLNAKFHFLGATFAWLKVAAADTFGWIKDHWQLLLEILIGPLGWTILAWRTFGPKLLKIFLDVINTIIAFGKDHWQLIVAILIGPVGLVLLAWKTFGPKLLKILVSAVKSAIDGLKDVGKWIADAFSDAVHAIGDGLEDIGKRIIKAIVRGIMAAPSIIKDAISSLLDKVPGGGALKKGASFVAGGISKAKFWAKGGPVPGTGSGDTVHGMLTPGEHVITKQEVANAGGHGVIFALRALLGGGGQSSTGRFATGGAVAPGFFSGGAQAGVHVNLNADVGDQAHTTRLMWQEIVAATKRGASLVEARTRDLRVAVTKTINKLHDDFTDQVVAIEMSGKVHIKRLGDAWEDTFNDMQSVTFKGLNYIGHETNLALTSLGSKHIDFGLAAPTAEHHAQGGIVGKSGQRGRDKVLTWLGKGEAVLNHWQQAAANAMLPGGMTINGIVDSVRGFHAGGFGQPGYAAGKPGRPDLFNGHPSNVNPYVLALIKLMKQHFPLLQVTSTTDHSFLTTSGNQSDHTVGAAVDLASGDYGYMNKAAAWVKTSGLYKKIKQGIHNPNLAIQAGHIQTPPGRFAGHVWAEHANHIHLAIIDALGKFADAADGTLKSQKVTGPAGALRTMLQAAVDKVRKAAGIKIDSANAESGDFDVSALGKSGGGKTKNIALGQKMASAFGWTGGMFDALRTLWMGESGWDELIVNRESGAYGIPQSLPGNKMASKGADWKTNAATQIAWGLDYIKSVYKNPRNALSQWMARSPHWYADGGEIPGPFGKATPIVAHAGEWVVNKLQQTRLAKMLGLNIDALRSMMGFHGSTAGAAGGLAVIPSTVGDRGTRHDINISRNLDDANQILDAIGKIFSTINIKKLGLGGKKLKAFVTAISTMLDEGTGTLDTLGADLTSRIAKMAVALKRATYGAGQTITKKLDDVEVARVTLANLVSEMPELQAIKTAIQKGLIAVNKRLADPTISKTLREQLEGQANDFEKRLDTVNGQIADNLEARYNAQIAVEQARLAAQQKEVDKINNGASRAAAAQDVIKRIATAFGNTGIIASVNNDIVASLQDQQNKLREELPRIQALHTDDGDTLANTILDQIDGLNAQIAEQIAQNLQDTIDTINNKATRSNTQLDLVGRMLDATGALGLNGVASAAGITSTRSGVFSQRQAVAVQQMNELNAARQTAIAQGNTKAVQDLTDQIDELNVTVAENTKAALDARVDDINTRASRASGQLDLISRMADALGVVGLQGVASAAGITSSRGDIFSRRSALLGGQRSELQGALGQAASQGNMQTVQDLTDQLAELDVTIQENTKAAFDARVADVNDRSGFSLGINDLNTQIITLQGQISGQTNQTALLRAAQEKQNILMDKGSDLQQLLDEAISANNQQEVQDLTQAVLENNVATLQNTVNIKELTGATNQQSFTSSAWTQFRQALFNGEGSLIPNAPRNGPTSINGGPGMSSISSSSSRVQNFDIDIHADSEPVDPVYISQRIGFIADTLP